MERGSARLSKTIFLEREQSYERFRTTLGPLKDVLHFVTFMKLGVVQIKDMSIKQMAGYKLLYDCEWVNEF